MNRISQFVNELKRRNVFRAGAAYLVLAWLGIQIADILLEAFIAPDWMMRAIVIGFMIGFPVTLILAWIYEITVGGVKRTEEVLPEESIGIRTGRKIDFAIIGLLSVAVVFFALDRFVWKQNEDDAATVSHNYSMAVLTFQVTPAQGAPFLGQLSSDVSRLLQRSSQLRLASADAIKALPINSSLADIATRLGVRYLIAGAIRLDGSDVSLSVSLFDIDVGENIWASEFENAQLQQTTNAAAEAILVEINGKPLSLLTSANDPRAYEIYLRARQHLATEEMYEEAEGLYRDALRLEARFPLALAGLCDFLVNRYRIKKLPSDFAEAEQLCYRAWTIDSQSAEVQRALGYLYATSGQVDKARESYNAAMAINPNDLKTQSRLANTYFDEQPELAEIQLKRVIEQHPGSPDAYLALQYLYFKQGRYAEAVEPAKWAVRLDPSNEDPKFRLAADLFLAGMFSEAKSLLMQMLQAKSPSTGRINGQLATVLFYEGDYSGAAELYQDAIESSPRESTHHRNLGDAVWHSDGKKAAEPIFRETIQLAEKAHEINPDEINALSSLVVGYGSIGNSARFQTVKNKTLDLYATDPYMHYDIAVGASRLGDMGVARLHAEKALELGMPPAMLRADPDITATGGSFN